VKRNPRRARREPQALRLWSYDQARTASPYIASIVRSLREHTLEIQGWRRRLDALSARPGRPDRQTLIAIDEAKRDLAAAEKHAQEALDELQALDIYPHDILQGQVLVPFVQDEQLAWFIFDLFAPHHFQAWRYQSDPESTRRRLPAGV